MKRLLLALAALLATPALAAPPMASTPALSPTGDASKTTVQVLGAPTSNADTQAAWWADFLNVRRFKHPGDPDDTLSFNRMCAYAQTAGNSVPKTVTIPTYAYSVAPPSPTTPVCTITGSYWHISGKGQSSIINMTADGELFRFDISTITSNDNSIEGFRTISNLGAGNQTNVIRLYCATPGASPCKAATHFRFQNLTGSGIYRLVKLDKTSYTSWGDGSTIQNYGQLDFLDLDTDSSTGLLPYEVVHIDGGPGAHNIFRGGDWAATNTSLYIGDGNDGVGDQLIEDIHMTDGANCLTINGPTNLTRYRTNITVTGNQFDGCSVSTFTGSNLQAIRFALNNSTSAVGVICPGCTFTDYEDRFHAEAKVGTPLEGFPAGTTSKGLWSVTRVPADGVTALNDVVKVHAFCHGVIGTVGPVAIDAVWLVEFQSTSSTTIINFSGPTPYGPGASYLSVNLAQSGTTGAVATYTITGAPSTNTLTCNEELNGNSAQIQLVTGS